MNFVVGVTTPVVWFHVFSSPGTCLRFHVMSFPKCTLCTLPTATAGSRRENTSRTLLVVLLIGQKKL